MEKLNFKNIFFTVTGTLILAYSASAFLIPNNILTGGVSGISVIVSPVMPNVDKQIIAAGLSVLTFVIGVLFLGKKFVVSTVLSTVVYSLAMTVFTIYPVAIEIEPLLASVYGGLLGGAGIGIVMRQGGSTGGMDVPPLIMEKYFRIEVSKGILVVDAITVFFGLIEYNLSAVLTGLISVYFTSLGVKKMIDFGASSAKEIKIISDKYREINDEILDKIDRGTTMYQATGGYTGQDRKVLVCVCFDNQYQTVLDTINKYDDKAFVVVTDVHDVHGEGFTAPVRI